MQSVQFLVEDGDCHRRNGNLGLALKRYFAVQKVFNEVEDDQYDFHGYSMRKFTLNVYMESVSISACTPSHSDKLCSFISWEDRLRLHPAYIHSAIAASQVSSRHSI